MRVSQQLQVDEAPQREKKKWHELVWSQKQSPHPVPIVLRGSQSRTCVCHGTQATIIPEGFACCIRSGVLRERAGGLEQTAKLMRHSLFHLWKAKAPLQSEAVTLSQTGTGRIRADTWWGPWSVLITTTSLGFGVGRRMGRWELRRASQHCSMFLTADIERNSSCISS